MKIAIVSLLATLVVLQACGNSDNKKAIVKQQVNEVHGIQPDKVPNYIENFKLQYEQLDLQIDGVKYSLSFFDTDDAEKVIIAKYGNGLIYLGFDFEKEQPINSIMLLEGDISDLEDFKPTAILKGSNIELSEREDNMVYQGSIEDVNTKKLYSIRAVINESLLEAGDSTLTLEGNVATLNGTLGTATYIQMDELIKTKSFDTLKFGKVSGSINDDINMHTGRLIRAAKLTTLMPTGSFAYSGGVDLFAAGNQRIFQDGGELGVHSWCCLAGKDAGQLSKTDPAHGAQLTYFREMLGAEKGPEFYFFTINAAPAASIHKMKKAEMVKYSLITE
ncbi:hypothetical protein Sden_0559 [Shewanella denitrificans OS217]|jgi:hypothetical protein|uniref:Lipoprotein n=1 Tax=Shewanella denitrificans (strain OS217 / ATCC BAA-1090 / DSM 15013) TaxID=318161 RepID=Q12RS7_SHEDO|nr:hypothetical protein [Shewanella denitrificans]ABE53849.1 hypothetical protein Sden_0559 [Shewanella denitrificans OS217]